MYRCMKCGHIGKRPLRVLDEDGTTHYECRECSGTDVSPDISACNICGKILFEGDPAYEAGKLLMCTECVTKVRI